MVMMLKKLTQAALATLLVVTVAGILPYFAGKIPDDHQDVICKAQIFAVFTVLILSLGLLGPAMILHERLATRTIAAVRNKLKMLPKLAFLAVVVAVHRILPYLFDDIPRNDLQYERVFIATFIAIVGISWLFKVPPNPTSNNDRATSTATTGGTIVKGARNRRLNRAVKAVKKAALASIVISACRMLRFLTDKVPSDGPGVLFVIHVFAVFTTLVLGSGLLVSAMPLREMPGTIEAVRGGDGGRNLAISHGYRHGRVVGGGGKLT